MKRPPYSIRHRREVVERWREMMGRDLEPPLRAAMERTYEYRAAEFRDAFEDVAEAVRSEVRRVGRALRGDR